MSAGERLLLQFSAFVSFPHRRRLFGSELSSATDRAAARAAAAGDGLAHQANELASAAERAAVRAAQG